MVILSSEFIGSISCSVARSCSYVFNFIKLLKFKNELSPVNGLFASSPRFLKSITLI